MITRAIRRSLALPLIITCLALLLVPAQVNAEGFSVTIDPDKESASLGEQIIYTYTIINSTTENITNLALSDNGVQIPLTTTTLSSGENVIATRSFVVSLTDYPGPLINVATASGTMSSGDNVTASGNATVELTSPPSDEMPSIEVSKSADKTAASPGDNITYTYIITNTGNVTVDNVTLQDNKLGELMSGVTLSPGENVTTTAIYEVKADDFWKLKPITNIATVTATGSNGEPISATSKQVSVVPHKAGMFKAMILWLSGVPGKGIEKAPGLQKPFNLNSQAAEHAGEKDKPGTSEQLRIREREENQGTDQQLQTQLEVENEARSGKVQQSTNSNGQNKPKKNPKWGDKR